ncbi:MAG TPA: amino acid adenylation domain-containing protein, partial [Thermoanaerobaculia bacterium]|nr:amino acid adenylation domain-containing protein [Thermoanaerobaculia bacterium]
PGSVAYNIPLPVHLTGALEPAVLAAVLGEVVRRHEVLRTAFPAIAGRPTQVIAPPCGLALPVVDLAGLPGETRAAETARLMAADAALPFDLARGPLLRAAFLRRAAAEHTLLLDLHHIISDGWSTGVLVREVAALYTALAAGRPSPLPELAVQYADFALWQRGWLAGEVLAGELGYWRERLSGAPRVLDLPLDRPRPAVSAGTADRAGRLRRQLPGSLGRGLRQLGREAGREATLFMVLLAAWSAFLARISGQEEVVVGAAVANRTHRETEGLLGFFVNTLALRTDLTGDPEFALLLGRVRQATLADYAHQDLPFERLVGEVAGERSLSHSPLFQVLLILQEAPAERLELPGLTLEALPVVGEAAKFDLSLAFVETPAGLDGFWEYRASLFDATTVARFAAAFTTLLAGAVERPAARLSELPLLGAVEAHQLVVEWNDGWVAYPGADFVHERFAARVAAAPDAVAVGVSGVVVTYGELDARAGRLAGHLRRLGIRPESLVGIYVERSPAMVVGLLAILKAGGAYLPLDPSYPPERLAFMVADAGVRVLLTERRLAASVPAGADRIVLVDDLLEPAAQARGIAARSGLTPDHPAYVIYTSGSTGRPKGVTVPHRALANFLAAMAGRPGLAAGETLLAVTTLSFDIAGLELFLPLLVGGRIELVTREVASSGDLLAAALATSGAAALQATPATWRMLLDSGWQGDGELKALCGGEALPRDLADRLLGSAAALWNLFGPTETTVWVTAEPVAAAPGPVVIGRPIANTEIHLLSPALAPAPVGVPGELYIGGVALARGYRGRPDLTAERFLPDPFGGLGQRPGARLYRTGDLARRLPDGRIEHLGRLDTQVKIRGFRIELEEVEAALAAHPGVRQAVVVAVPGPGGDRRLIAYLVSAGEPASPAPAESHGDLGRELRTLLAARLPGYMLPAALVWLAALPLTPSRKVDRKALPALAWEGEGEAVYVAPRTPVEELVAAIWGEVLEVERVGAEDNFFTLGGHSLLATRVISRVRQAFGIDLPLRSLFEATTVATFARRIESARGGMTGPGRQAPPLVPVRRDRDLPLSFAQERLWLIDQMQPGSAAYNMPAVLRLLGGLDPASLDATFTELVRRHEVLRTTFRAVGGRPVQVVHPPAAKVLPWVDLAGLPASRREREAGRLARAEAWRPFDLVAGPLLRLTLFRLGGEPAEHLAFLTLHHSIADGWSMGVLVRELGALYPAFRAGRRSPLPEVGLQYADFAVWQREWLAGGELEALLAYWRVRLAGAPELIDLPLDRPRVATGSSGRAGRLQRELPGPLRNGLRRLGRREPGRESTLFMVLLAAWSTFLSRLGGQEELVVGTPIANRTRPEIEGLIGCFVNTLAFSTDLTGDPEFTALLDRVRQATLADYAHQDLPFERLVGELAGERSLGYSPIFQVVLALQNAPTERLELPGLTLEALPVTAEAAKFDLSLTLAETPAGLSGVWQYRASLFDVTTVARFAAAFTTLLAGAVERPAARLSELPLLSAAEAHQLVLEWNDGRVAYPGSDFVHELFAARAAAAPDAVAIVASGVALTYGELGARGDRLAGHLQRLGVRPESLVGIYVERSPTMVVGLLAILRAGGAYLPLDPSYPPERLAFMIADAGVGVLLTERRLAASIPAGVDRVVLVDDLPGAAATDRGAPAPSGLAPDHPAYVIYTSGSTGRPKGVVISHRSLANRLRFHAATDLDRETRLLQKTSISFDVSLLETFGPLLAGGCMVQARPGGERDVAYLARWIAEERITHTTFPPSLLAVLLEDAAFLACDSLRIMVTGTEAVPADLPGRFHARFDAELWNRYGPTECTIAVTAWECRPGEGNRVLPIGRPIARAEVSILDRSLAPVPLGATGEIAVGGVCLARGYLARPDATAEQFVPNPLSGAAPGARLYRTGDLARQRSDGAIEFLGRLDGQVKIRG